jgi:hypothetical protein
MYDEIEERIKEFHKDHWLLEQLGVKTKQENHNLKVNFVTNLLLKFL